MINIELEKFSGPLDLLLKMIEKEEMDITQVSLAKITDQYLEYIGKKCNINMNDISDFLIVAAKLILIKSRAILPNLSNSDDEQEEEEFRQQLKMYKEFLRALEKIEEKIALKNITFARVSVKQTIEKFKFSPPKNLEINNLSGVFKSLINDITGNLEQRLEVENIEKEVNIEDKIAQIRESVIKKIKINFDYILSQAESKTEVIVSFLSLLELMKQKHIVVNQINLFGNIEIVRN